MDGLSVFFIPVWLFLLLFICSRLLSVLDKKSKTGDDAVSGSRGAQLKPADMEKEQYHMDSSGCLALLAGLFVGFFAGVAGTMLFAAGFF